MTQTENADNVVELHQYRRMDTIPNESPFCMKVEAFLRFHKIPYKSIEHQDSSGSPYNKLPYITHANKTIADSSIILDYLSTTFHVDMDAHLTPLQRATSVGIQRMVEEHLYFLYCVESFREEHGWALVLKALEDVPAEVQQMIRKAMLDQTKAQGLGRLPWPDLETRARKDLSAISTILGDQPFMMGEQMTTIDLVVFAMVAETCYAPYSPKFAAMVAEFRNLVGLTERVFERAFPEFPKVSQVLRP